ncbi:hypothetical protein CTAYLR_002693 [Chrysophaeum taylorii]|uniref:Cytochrome P450 n=1 Tax=Chrysophaeum taylorii TaxID=2483200 RepID=A0AAD7XN28_9STRA|nr:hypothetical protein CTAYLR_002693 [Chrysophaeum taylorii]
MTETLRKLNCSETPWYLLKLALELDPGHRVFRLALPPLAPTTVVVADPHAARFVLSSKGVDKPYVYQEFAAMTKGLPSVFTRKSSDPQQSKIRKGVAPAFSARRVEAAMASDGTARVIEELFRILDSGEPFDPAETMTMATLDILGLVSFGGFEFRTLRGGDSSTGRIFLEELPLALAEYSLRRMFDPFRKYYYLFTAEGRRAQKAADTIFDIARQVLENRPSGSSSSSSILDHVVATNGYASRDERIADVLNFLIGGHDTTGFSLAFALFEIAKKGRDFAARIRAELRAGTEDLLERVIKEAMRLWPVAAMGSFREVTNPGGLVIPDTGLYLPEGATCVTPLFPILRAAPGVEDPDVFDPDRWLDPDQAQALRDAHFPFSLGSRNCVGMALAMAEIRHVLAALIEHYDFALVSDFETAYFLTLKPKGGLLRATKVLHSSVITTPGFSTASKK